MLNNLLIITQVLTRQKLTQACDKTLLILGSNLTR